MVCLFSRALNCPKDPKKRLRQGRIFIRKCLGNSYDLRHCSYLDVSRNNNYTYNCFGVLGSISVLTKYITILFWFVGWNQCLGSFLVSNEFKKYHKQNRPGSFLRQNNSGSQLRHDWNSSAVVAAAASKWPRGQARNVGGSDGLDLRPWLCPALYFLFLIRRPAVPGESQSNKTLAL